MARLQDQQLASTHAAEALPSSHRAALACRGVGGRELGAVWAIGSRFGKQGRYELGEPIGVGGSAVVHRVFDHQSGRTLAGKFPLSAPDGFGEVAIRRESAMLARLRHECIIALVEQGEEADALYLLLEYLPGDSLSCRIASGHTSVLEATRILRDVGAGLAHAHQHGIFHLDLKPSNVMVLPSGRAKLIDFGAGSMPVDTWTSLEEEPPSQRYELDGVATRCFVKGTLHYMAPEQWGLDPSHPSMDLWAAGMIYYEMLTGQLPFGSKPACLRLRSSHSARVPFSAAALGLPPAVEDVLAHTLALDPYERFASAERLLDALARVEASLELAAAP